jgi:carboxyl-terminal processing protease
MPNHNSRPAILFLTLVIIASGFAGAVYAQHGSNSASSDSEVRENLKSFSQVYDIIEQNYAEPVSPDKAIYDGAIPGMLHVLDPHSNFFDPKQYAQLREDQSGKYYGVDGRPAQQ